MTNQTMEKLYQMRLGTMAEAFREQLAAPSMAELGFEERVGLMVEREWSFREGRKLSRRLKQARLRQQATVEDIDYRHRRGLEKSVMLSLATCRWVREHQNVIVTGPTGIGKSYISEALAEKACREGFTALRYRAPEFFRELTVAEGDGSLGKLLARLARMDVLVVDDWGLAPLSGAERRHFLEMLDDRHGLRSTVMTSQYPVSGWHELIGEPTMADAILDRLVHNAHKLNLKGESMRKTRSNLTPSVQ